MNTNVNAIAVETLNQSISSLEQPEKLNNNLRFRTRIEVGICNQTKLLGRSPGYLDSKLFDTDYKNRVGTNIYSERLF